MYHLLYLMFQCDFDVMENLESLEKFEHLNTRDAPSSSCGLWAAAVAGDVTALLAGTAGPPERGW